MEFEFTEKDVKKLAQVLGVPGKRVGNNYRFEIVNKAAQRKLAL